jgi:hypothetical protein
MSLDKIPKTDRFQVMTAVLFMTLFAAVFLIIVVPKDNLRNFMCTYVRDFDAFAQMCSISSLPPLATGSDQLVAARITSACLDSEGLKMTVTFDEPLVGTSNIQVFSTGEDYFPSEQGISDSFRMNLAIPSAADHLDIIIPVDSMPAGEQIFGNIVINDEGVSSYVAYFVDVSNCSSTSVPLPNLTPNEVPIISSATCLPSRQLMIAFEFEGAVLGQYRALVADTPYQLASVINQPAMLFFSGEPPPEGPIVIRLISATDEVVVFEETYTPPVCSST